MTRAVKNALTALPAKVRYGEWALIEQRVITDLTQMAAAPVYAKYDRTFESVTSADPTNELRARPEDRVEASRMSRYREQMAQQKAEHRRAHQQAHGGWTALMAQHFPGYGYDAIV